MYPTGEKFYCEDEECNKVLGVIYKREFLLEVLRLEQAIKNVSKFSK